MRPRRSTLAIAILSTLVGVTAYAQNSDLQAQLVEQGQYWQARANAQRATEVWQKVLRLDPNQVNALYGMGAIGVKQNNAKQAQEYLKRLQALSPMPWQARQLEQDIALARPENKALLDEARRLVDAGERDKATEVFQRMFNGLTPQGTVGREYYNNLAFNDASWPEARRGMERLIREMPDDSILVLFYGKQLIRHEDSRAEGARLLQRLTKREDIAGDADESWRLALVWMGPPKPSQVPLFEEFLRVHPNDQEIRDQLNKGRQQSASSGGATWQQDPQVAAGLKALEKGDLAAAETAFQARLSTRPDDTDALGGLGIVRQQQNRHAEAEQLLTRAVNKGGSRWRTALDGVRYWTLLEQGRALQASGQSRKAQDVVNQAIRLDGKNIEGRLTLADIQAQAGENDAAIRNYRQVLAVQPGHPQAMRGMVGVLTEQGHAEEALRLLDSLSPAEQAKFGDAWRLRALRSSQLASVAEKRGDFVAAQSAYLDAIRNDPDDIWTRFNLARLYLKSGDTVKARNQIDTFVYNHPDNMDGLYTSALLWVEMGQWKDAQSVLNRIPADRRTADMHDLADQITLTNQTSLASSLAKRGQRQEALAVLDRLQPLVAGNVDRTATLAGAYADIGDTQRAQSMMGALVARNNSPSSELQLQYASILLKTGDDAQVHSILRSLQNQQMSVSTRKRYDDTLYLYRVRQADQLREGGDLEAAYDMLAPALTQRPGDATAMSALARMYAANGEGAKALQVYKPLVQRNQSDAGVLLGAADAAVQAQDRGYAETVLQRFTQLPNTDASSLTEAARIYRSMGKTGEATALLRKAVAMEQSEKQRGLAVDSDTWNAANNPFRGQRSQTAAAAAAVVPPPARTVLNRLATVPVGNPFAADAYRSEQVLLDPPATRSRASYPAQTSRSELVAPVNSFSAEQRPRSARNETARVDSTRISGARSATAASSPAQSALDEILQERSAYVVQGVNIRSNDSEPGLSKLTDVQMPLEVNMPVGDGSSRLALRITPVLLSAGTMNADAATRFGDTTLPPSAVGSRREEGVGIALSYELRDLGLKADIGTTPMGFEYNNVVGGVSIERPLEDNPNVRYGIALSRRAVTDSVTSFAGTTIRTATAPDGTLAWGGVTANGGRVQLSYDDSDVGVYGYGSLHSIDGHNVKSNTRVEVGAGAYRYFQNEPDSKLTAGVSAMLMGYANNQNFYTYGHGGYFSPQTYFALGVPVTWAKRNDQFTFQLKGSVGLQYFQQDGADYFPTNAAMQAANNQRYADQSNSGLGYGVEASGEYRFAPKLFVGGRFAMDNARDYRQLNASMYVRYMFENMLGSPMALPVSPYRSPYSN
ncbi:cellulose biosynthesis protein BcsC [Oxalicibacterium faecigallinarum]|uniref:Cellulose synthase n=1 Tax=Oxalicibacterium faecigallinarum TaxID=573741 RepID=A0A8J3AUR9_9BURK|nr:cellulose biosynthesis protein BcsC [Oxalicibacterium faecigallinarum]GGI16518.1 cellulose synthase [Oxalicibacterium faecigallinarum]